MGDFRTAEVLADELAAGGSDALQFGLVFGTLVMLDGGAEAFFGAVVSDVVHTGDEAEVAIHWGVQANVSAAASHTFNIPDARDAEDLLSYDMHFVVVEFFDHVE